MFFIYVNLWFTHQAHLGDILVPGHMTKAYYWKTFLTYEKNQDYLKLLDTDEYFEGIRHDIKPLHFSKEKVSLNDLENQSFFKRIPINSSSKWLRIGADFTLEEKEWSVWKMTKMIVRFKNKGKTIKENMIKIQRHIDRYKTKEIFIDVNKPIGDFDEIEVQIINNNKFKNVLIEDLYIETYD